jgi:trans-aconitate methyltransferase
LPDALRVVEILKNQLARARSVVDLGCGTGALIERLADHAPHATVIGLDASAPRIAELRTRFGESPLFRFEVHDARDPLPDYARGVDVITMTAVLHWLHPDESETLNQIARALSPDGTAVLTTYHPSPGDSGLGGTDEVIAEAAGLRPELAAETFKSAGLVGISARTLPAKQLDALLRNHFSAVVNIAHTATTAPADGLDFADYVDATFGDYYQALFPDRAAQRAAVAAAAQHRLDTAGAVTTMPVRIWRCTLPKRSTR